jgi:hypothetical protein
VSSSVQDVVDPATSVAETRKDRVAAASLGCETPVYAPDRRPLATVDAADRAGSVVRRCRPGAWLTSPDMAGFGDAPLVRPGPELQLTIDGRAVPHEDVVAQVQLPALAGARETLAGDAGEGLERANLYAVAGQRAATASTRRQYVAIYRSFGDWLRQQLGRRRSSRTWTPM